MTLAFSYVRFSHPEQAKGDSLRRQSERAADYCRRRGWNLDSKLTLRDLGVSAFKGKNAAVGNFRTFLDGIKTGHVPAGSVLLVESFDRISRQGIDEGYDLIKGILKAGVRIVTLSPEREFDSEATRGLTKGALEIQLILERAAEESEMKSKRVGAAWANKHKHAAERVITRRLPGWIIYRDGKLTLDKEKATTIRRAFALAREGHGATMIAKLFNDERVPVTGRTVVKGKPVVWSESNVYHLLTTRTVCGEYQAFKGRWPDRKPVGNPVADYYPRIISEDDWHATQAALKNRARVGRGRRGSHINLFAGLLIDARDGEKLSYNHQGSHKLSTIVPIGARQGKGQTWTSFPVVAFDMPILRRLAEVKPSDIGAGDDATHKVEALTGRRDELDRLIRAWSAKMDDLNTVAIVGEKLAEYGAERRKVDAELAEAQQEAATPMAESWGEFRSLADLMEADPSDELRVKVRAALRRTIEGVYCLFAGNGATRLAAVRVQFRGSDRHRDYVISYRPPVRSWGKQHREAEIGAVTFAEAGIGPLDLRKRADVAKVERLLKAIDPADLSPKKDQPARPAKIAGQRRTKV